MRKLQRIGPVQQPLQSDGFLGLGMVQSMAGTVMGRLVNLWHDIFIQI
mgnify:CR=1 FL=1